MNFLDVLTAIVMMGPACWRISSLIVGEDGPWFIFDRIRRWVKAGDYNHFPDPDRRWYIGIFECVWCCSIWVGAGFAIVYLVDHNFALYLSLPFTLSAIAVITHHLIERLEP